MDSRPTTTQAFQLRINFLIDAKMVTQFRRRPHAVLVLRTKERQLQQTPQSVTLLHCTGATTGVATDPLLHHKTEESVDVRKRFSGQARKVHRPELILLKIAREKQKLAKEARRRMRLAVAKPTEYHVGLQFFQQSRRLRATAGAE